MGNSINGMAIDGWLGYNLVGGDWNHGMDYDFPWNSWEWISSSQLLHSLHDFSEGLVAQPPSSFFKWWHNPKIAKIYPLVI